MTNRVLLALICVLIVVRLPSLVQPMGADQGLYAYIGDRIRSGDLPYRDAWDQKPPAIHVAYAAMRAILPRDAAVPAADLVAAAAIALMLWHLGGALAAGSVGPGRRSCSCSCRIPHSPVLAASASARNVKRSSRSR